MVKSSLNSRLEKLEKTLSTTSHPDALTKDEKFSLSLEVDAVNYVTPLHKIDMPLSNRCRTHWGARTWRRWLKEHNQGKFFKKLSREQKDYILYGRDNKQIIIK